MIRSFAHRGLRDFWETGRSRRINPAWHERIALQLDTLDQASEPEHMNLAGWRFHRLRGRGEAGRPRYSIRVSANWRLTWEWDAGDAYRVDLEDYH